MRYENLEPLTIALYLEQRGFDENLIGQFRSGIDRVTAVMDDYEIRMAEIKTSKHQTNAERDALAQGLTEKAVSQLDQEKQRLGGYDGRVAQMALLSDKEAQQRQTEVEQVRRAHHEAVDAAMKVVRPEEDPVVAMAR